jgi:protein-disulfide isomerase
MRPVTLSLLLLLGCAARYAPPARCATANRAPLAAAALDDSEAIPVGSSPVLGPRGAAVTVVVFSDFQCPYCNRGRHTLHDLRAALPDDVRVVWKNLPLARHADAPAAAEAALEVFAQGGDAAFWRYHDLLFAHQDRLARADLERYAETLGGIDLARFRRALDEGVHTAAVEADVALAARLEVDGTPAFFVNGTPIVGARPLATFEAIAGEILARARARGVTPSFYADSVRDPVPPPERDERGGWAETHNLPAPPDAPSLGPADAPVVLQVFSDFQCPYCARVEPTLAALRAHYGERLRVVWRDYPLPGHAHAMPAAEAAREVRAQRGDAAFWRFHDALFEHGGELSPAVFEALAAPLDVDLPRLRAALDDHRHVPAIRADMEAIQGTGVRFGTPAFFINGHFLAGARPVAEFRGRIDSLLRPAP